MTFQKALLGTKCKEYSYGCSYKLSIIHHILTLEAREASIAVSRPGDISHAHHGMA